MSRKVSLVTYDENTGYTLDVKQLQVDKVIRFTDASDAVSDNVCIYANMELDDEPTGVSGIQTPVLKVTGWTNTNDLNTYNLNVGSRGSRPILSVDGSTSTVDIRCEKLNIHGYTSLNDDAILTLQGLGISLYQRECYEWLANSISPFATPKKGSDGNYYIKNSVGNLRFIAIKTNRAYLDAGEKLRSSDSNVQLFPVSLGFAEGSDQRGMLTFQYDTSAELVGEWYILSKCERLTNDTSVFITLAICIQEGTI